MAYYLCIIRQGRWARSKPGRRKGAPPLAKGKGGIPHDDEDGKMTPLEMFGRKRHKRTKKHRRLIVIRRSQCGWPVLAFASRGWVAAKWRREFSRVAGAPAARTASRIREEDFGVEPRRRGGRFARRLDFEEGTILMASTS